MQDYMMIFRFEPNFDYQPTEQELATQQKSWESWIGSIAAESKFVSTSQLDFDGRVLAADGKVQEATYTSNNTIVGGNMVVRASSIDEALELSKGSPVLHMGGSVEVRQVIPM